MIRKWCKREKITVRQFARGIKNEMIELLMTLEDQAPDGNQSKKYEIRIRKCNKRRSCLG